VDDSSQINTLAALRIAIGAGAWLMPRVAGRLFGLDVPGNPQAPYLARLFGIRDIALGLGTLTSSGESRRLWLQLGIACDLGDAAASWLGGRDESLPRYASVMTGATALSAAGIGVAALASS
jgi:hypothetical protein